MMSQHYSKEIKKYTIDNRGLGVDSKFSNENLNVSFEGCEKIG